MPTLTVGQWALWGDRTIALVESSRPDPEHAGDCITRVHGVGVVRGVVELAPFAERMASCLPLLWDDAMFFGPFEGKARPPAR